MKPNIPKLSLSSVTGHTKDHPPQRGGGAADWERQERERERVRRGWLKQAETEEDEDVDYYYSTFQEGEGEEDDDLLLTRREPRGGSKAADNASQSFICVSDADPGQKVYVLVPALSFPPRLFGGRSLSEAELRGRSQEVLGFSDLEFFRLHSLPPFTLASAVSSSSDYDEESSSSSESEGESDSESDSTSTSSVSSVASSPRREASGAPVEGILACKIHNPAFTLNFIERTLQQNQHLKIHMERSAEAVLSFQERMESYMQTIESLRAENARLRWQMEQQEEAMQQQHQQQSTKRKDRERESNKKIKKKEKIKEEDGEAEVEAEATKGALQRLQKEYDVLKEAHQKLADKHKRQMKKMKKQLKRQRSASPPPPPSPQQNNEDEQHSSVDTEAKGKEKEATDTCIPASCSSSSSTTITINAYLMDNSQQHSSSSSPTTPRFRAYSSEDAGGDHSPRLHHRTTIQQQQTNNFPPTKTATTTFSHNRSRSHSHSHFPHSRVAFFNSETGENIVSNNNHSHSHFQIRSNKHFPLQQQHSQHQRRPSFPSTNNRTNNGEEQEHSRDGGGSCNTVEIPLLNIAGIPSASSSPFLGSSYSARCYSSSTSAPPSTGPSPSSSSEFATRRPYRVSAATHLISPLTSPGRDHRRLYCRMCKCHQFQPAPSASWICACGHMNVKHAV
ncbi:hypothetical protein QOT17_016354 [Balamuthia mandrillaris]